jgi:hypothetical protein
MAGLDDCNILQLRHLVQNRLRGMHYSISIQTLRSHNFAIESTQAMRHMTIDVSYAAPQAHRIVNVALH